MPSDVKEFPQQFLVDISITVLTCLVLCDLEVFLPSDFISFLTNINLQFYREKQT